MIVCTDQWQELHSFVSIALLKTPNEDSEISLEMDKKGRIPKNNKSPNNSFNYLLHIGTDSSPARKLEVQFYRSFESSTKFIVHFPIIDSQLK